MTEAIDVKSAVCMYYYIMYMYEREYQGTKENTLAISKVKIWFVMDKCNAMTLYLTIRGNFETRYSDELLAF